MIRKLSKRLRPTSSSTINRSLLLALALGALISAAARAETSAPQVSESCKPPLAASENYLSREQLERLAAAAVQGSLIRGTPSAPMLPHWEYDVVEHFLLDLASASVRMPIVISNQIQLMAGSRFSSELTTQVFVCFPYLGSAIHNAEEAAKLLAAQREEQEHTTREKAEARKAAARRAEQEELERDAREEEEARKEQEVAEEAANRQREAMVAEAAKPANVLKAEYGNYIFVKRCYEVRQGYLTVYISDAEMVRAKTAISVVEEKIKPKLPPGVTTDALWSQAEADEAKSAPGGGALTLNQLLQQPENSGQRYLCQNALNALFDAQAHIDPQANQVQKDFP